MPKSLDTLPAALLDAFVAHALSVSPSLRLVFLASLGSRIHASCVRVLFSSLAVPDDGRIFRENSIISPVLSDTDRYAGIVRSLVIREPRFPLGLKADASSRADYASDSSSDTRPIEASQLSLLLEACSNLEEFVWRSPFPPPDGVCEFLSTHNVRLTRFSYAPNSTYQKGCLPKWDAPSLPLLSSLSLTSLELSRLSQAGARAFSGLLSNIGEFSSLEDISIDFVWLDDALCEKVVEAGRRLRKLQIGTSGTKLSDRGITAIAEGCDALEDLALREVQGRLSRTLWSKPSNFPSTLTTFRVVINEAGTHHSWTTDHLMSLDSIPLESLSNLFVVRMESPPRLENGIPIYERVIDDTVALKPVPPEVVDRMRSAPSLTRFECDWWAWSIADLKVVLENCPKLETIRICLDDPFSKLFTLTSTFASLSNLGKLSVSVNPVHAPGEPPVPSLPYAKSSLPTPTDSPVLKAKSVLPQLLDFDQMQTQTCLASHVAGDPSMPLMRDVKRFVRKCPQLALLEWYGKAGRGSWSVTRPTTGVSKISMNVTVEYIPPMISEDAWQKMIRRQEAEEAAKSGWTPDDIERVGNTWTGPMAEALSAERAASTQKEDSSPTAEKERPGRLRENGRKAKPTPFTFTTSGDFNDYQLPTPSRSSHSTSPVQSFSPLTPPTSERSVSVMLSSVSESTESDSLREDVRDDTQALRRRAPSEPSLRTKGSSGVRTRSAAASGSREQQSDTPRNGYSNGRNSRPSNGAASNGSKPGRGRGARTGRGVKKNGHSNGSGATGDFAGRGSGDRERGHGSSGTGGRGRKPSTH